MRRWLAYAVTSALLHRLLEAHYHDACRPSWWPIPGGANAYCALVHRALQLLSASPLLAVASGVHHDVVRLGRQE